MHDRVEFMPWSQRLDRIDQPPREGLECNLQAHWLRDKQCVYLVGDGRVSGQRLSFSGWFALRNVARCVEFADELTVCHTGGRGFKSVARAISNVLFVLAIWLLRRRWV